MRKNEIEVGGVYYARVSREWRQVKILAVSPHGGWEALNLATGRRIHLRSAGRLHRRPAVFS